MTLNRKRFLPHLHPMWYLFFVFNFISVIFKQLVWKGPMSKPQFINLLPFFFYTFLYLYYIFQKGFLLSLSLFCLNRTLTPTSQILTPSSLRRWCPTLCVGPRNTPSSTPAWWRPTTPLWASRTPHPRMTHFCNISPTVLKGRKLHHLTYSTKPKEAAMIWNST